MKSILFQGDSITDCFRPKDNDCYMGMGYATIVRGRLGYENPGKYKFYNRGISGDRLLNVYSRQKNDIVKLKPDYMSVLVGINDVFNGIDSRDAIPYDRFEEIYCMFMEDMQIKLPNTKIMLLEPFYIEGASATANNEEYPDKSDFFRKEVRSKANAVKRVAKKYNKVFVPLQDKINDFVSKVSDLSEITVDGIHLTAVGHEIIAREWLNGFKEL